MNAIRTFEVYLVDDKPYGYEIEKPFPASAHGFEYAYRFPGKSAHIVIVSHDRDIDRPIALYFAKAIAFKTFKVIHIDLTEVSHPCPTRHKK